MLYVLAKFAFVVKKNILVRPATSPRVVMKRKNISHCSNGEARNDMSVSSILAKILFVVRKIWTY